MTFSNAIYVADNFNREAVVSETPYEFMVQFNDEAGWHDGYKRDDFIVQGDDGNLIYEIGE
ncbi:MAG: hypothetical protein KAJ39_10605 [Gammaproteobacteria bacterium]|nr:hypothetical protein [Gammaproteobacteria bacterium]